MGLEAHAYKGTGEDFRSFYCREDSAIEIDPVGSYPHISEAFYQGLQEIIYIGLPNYNFYHDGMFDAPWMLFDVADEEYIYNRSKPNFYWLPDKVKQIYEAADWPAHRVRVVQRCRENPFDMAYSLGTLEGARIFLRLCAEHDLGIWFG